MASPKASHWSNGVALHPNSQFQPRRTYGDTSALRG
jgi:hypothetical protein